MHPWLRLALAFCPREYRREYAAAIGADVAARNVGAFSAAVDLLHHGIAMHLEDRMRDIRFAARSIAKAPLFTSVVVLAIGLAIGANVAVGSVLEGVLFHPLPYPHAKRLVVVGETPNESNLSYPEARDIARRSQTLSGIALAAHLTATLTGNGSPAQLAGKLINGSYFHVFGVQPQLGRLLDDRDRGTRNIVVSDAAWHRYFGGSVRAIGSRLRLNERDYTVVGVAPRGLANVSFWRVLNPHNAYQSARGNYFYEGTARLRRGVSVPAARADLRRVVLGLYRQYPQNHGTFRGVLLRRLMDSIVGPVRSFLWLLYAAVTIVLLVACANVANLSFVRAATRARELTVRSALGASRGRVLAQLGTEAAILACCGGALGVLLGWSALQLFSRYADQLLPRWENVHVDGVVLAYTAVLIALTTLLTGILPAFGQHRDTAQDLRSTGRADDRPSAKRVRAALVVTEVALTIALVVCAGLILRSFVNATNVSTGFTATNLYDVQFSGLPAKRYHTITDVLLFAQRVLHGLSAIPGVTNVAAANGVPFNDFTGNTTQLLLPSLPDPHASVDINAATPGFFSTMRIPLLEGRDFNGFDRAHTRPVAIVNAAFARRFFGTTHVVGRLIQPGICAVCQANSPSEFPKLTIVGVVGDARATYDRPYAPIVFFAMPQFPNFQDFVVRTDGHNGGITKAVDAVFRTADPMLPRPEVVPYATLLSDSRAQVRFELLLFGSLALLALFLALAGVYAVTAYSVEQRMHEFGIRKAIGASNRSVVTNVIAGAMRQTAIGITLGLGIAAAFSHLLTSLLFQTSPLDIPTFVAVIVLLAACSILAALAPAVYATRVPPAAALHYE